MSQRHLIRPAAETDIQPVRVLLREYAAWVGNHICFQAFERELAELPGRYAPPEGRLLLAIVNEVLAGCIALRPLEGGVCEMKRLYVRPQFRGSGLGRALAVHIIRDARQEGYRVMRLDSLPRMDQAIAMYRALGFREIPRYGDNPESAMCFELGLTVGS